MISHQVWYLWACNIGCSGPPPLYKTWGNNNNNKWTSWIPWGAICMSLQHRVLPTSSSAIEKLWTQNNNNKWMSWIPIRSGAVSIHLQHRVLLSFGRPTSNTTRFTYKGIQVQTIHTLPSCSAVQYIKQDGWMVWGQETLFWLCLAMFYPSTCIHLFTSHQVPHLLTQ
jgi:hypothetical protein